MKVSCTGTSQEPIFEKRDGMLDFEYEGFKVVLLVQGAHIRFEGSVGELQSWLSLANCNSGRCTERSSPR